MPEVTLEQTTSQVRDLFNKGFSAFERGNLDYAIDMLMHCVETEPGLLRARKFLRAAQLQRAKRLKSGALSKGLNQVLGAPQLAKVALLTQMRKGAKAIAEAEKLLCRDPLNLRFLHAFANAADKAGFPETAIQTLEIARDQFPDNADVLAWLGDLYIEVSNTRDGLACFERLADLRPNDPAIVKKLKDAMALNSMARDGWEDAAAEGGSFRDMIKDSEEAVNLEIEAKAVKSDRDADSLIASTLLKIKAEPENINYYRSLARLYSQKQRFEESLQTIDRALKISPGDPELDQLSVNTRAEQYEARIAEFEAAGETASAEALISERNEFVLASLTERVKRYPNELRLRFELGVALFEREQFNAAIQQFQMSQRNPKTRTRSFYYLAMCFKTKGQHDMALEQLEAAVKEMPTMDEAKMDIVYEMAKLCEVTGQIERAGTLYKSIYQVDIGYRDIAEKVEQVYKQ